MKRWILCLLALLLTMAGCQASDNAYTLQFYYRSVAPAFSDDSGILGMELHRFGAEVPTFQEIFDAYLTVPQDPTLASPFPKALKSLSTSLTDGLLTIRLSPEFDELSGYGRTVAVACLARTVLQIDGVDAIELEHETRDQQLRQSAVLTDADFVTRDLGAFNSETAVQLYFADLNGRYLVKEERKNIFTDAAQIPTYVVQQLLLGPTEAGLLGTIPEGTRLLELTVDDGGVCTVNLSSEFLLNRPGTELLERMCVFSIVNTLTELEAIKSVRLLADGQPIGTYLYMDLSQPLVRDELASAMVRTSLNEFDATLFVRSGDDLQLSAVPVSIRRAASSTLSENLLQALLDFSGINGLANPVPKGTTILSMEQLGEVCHVDLSPDFLQCAGNEHDELRATRAIAATLATLDGVGTVRISVNGRFSGLQYCDLSQLLIPNERWVRT